MMRVGSDLLLESSDGEWGTKCEVILPNIKGQRYVFGPSYPGEREGEEFIFTRDYKGLLPDPTHRTIITVDVQGQYWIQKEAFVTEEGVKAVEIRRLKSGDTISPGDSDYSHTRTGPWPHTIYCVKERIIGGGGSPLQIANEDWVAMTVTDFPSPLANNLECVVGSSGSSQTEGIDTDTETAALCKAINGLDFDNIGAAESPLDNTLILEKIMTYLPIQDLKKARLVSKKWGEEASKALEKRGKVSFTFLNYEKPENSTLIFRYLHEMRDLKMRNLEIRLFPSRSYSSTSPWQKMVDDLRKLLKSPNNFSTLVLRAGVETVADFLPFSIILQELGGTLVELTLDGIFQYWNAEISPPFPVMNNLKKFTHLASLGERVRSAFLHLLVPLFSNNLEHFTCVDDAAGPYLQTFLSQDQGMPNLRGIAIKGWALRKESLSLLLALNNPLKSLEIDFFPGSEEEVRLVEELLLKHSQTLQTLLIKIDNGYILNNNKNTFEFPPLPKVEELRVEYGRRTRIGWGNGNGLDYEAHLPSLRILTVKPKSSKWWREDDPVFNVFFPEEGELRCESVKELWVPILRNPKRSRYFLYAPAVDSFKPRMDQIRKMFPSAGKIDFLQ